MAPSHNFPPSVRLRRRAEFDAVFRGGRRVYTRGFQAHVLPRAEGEARLGIAVSRKVGGAVVRNRIKRLVRECFRLQRAEFVRAADVVIVARSEAAAMGFADCAQALETVWQLGKLLRG